MSNSKSVIGSLGAVVCMYSVFCAQTALAAPAKKKVAATEKTAAQAGDNKAASIPSPVVANPAPALPASPNNTAPPPASPTSRAQALRGRFHFDFNKAQIEDIVKVISEITERNFIIPEKVKGQKISIMSPTPVNVEEAFRAFLSALESNDLTVVKVGKFYKIIQSADAAKYPLPTYVKERESIPAADTMVTKILRLNFADANVVSNIMRTFISKFGQVAVYQPTNVLIISEYASNLVRIETIINKLDTGDAGSQIHLVQIQHASATEIANKLTDLFEIKGGKNRPVPPPSNGATPGTSVSDDQLAISKLIPDDRTNQLIVIANEYAVNKLKELIFKLDIPMSEESGQIRVISLQNANAEDLAQVLSSLASGTPAKKRGSGSANNSSAPPTPSAPAGAISGSLFEGDVKITADKATNSLLVTASPHDFRELKHVVDQLDLPRRQVFLELAIMEVSTSTDNTLGTDWYAGVPAPGGADSPFKNGVGLIGSPTAPGGTPFVASALNPTALLGTIGGALGGFSGTPIPIPNPAGGAPINLPSFAVLLRALQSSSNANIISTPYLLATDNEEAEIEVGSKIPFASGVGIPNLSGLSSVGSAGAAGAALGLLTQVQRIDVTLKIKLTPHINQSDRVLLEIDEQFEDVTGQKNVGGQEQPVTAKRNMKSKVIIEDQQSVVLGGLVRDAMRESVTKYPILGDIPILGWLFKKKSWTKEKLHLLVVITPYIIRSKADFTRIYERKQAEYKAFADLFYSDSKTYRANIDYTHKNGPIAMLGKTLKKELSQVENGGRGNKDDVIIIPNGGDMTAPRKEGDKAKAKAGALP